MTGEEMERIIADLLDRNVRAAERQQKLDEQIARTDEQLKVSAESLENLKAAVRRFREVSDRLIDPPAEQM